MRKEIFVYLILVILLTACINVNSLVNSLARENRIECEAVGFAGMSSKIYQKFEAIKVKASKEQLLELTYHDNLVVVGYSSYGLIDRELVSPFKLLERFIEQDERISTFCGCQMMSSSLPALIYHRYWNRRIEYSNEEDYENYIINDSGDLQKMDSLILYSKNPDWILLSRALENRIYSNTYKLRIEDWAFSEKNFYALKYVFKNLREGNEKKLISTLNDYLDKEDVYDKEKEEVNLMLKELIR